MADLTIDKTSWKVGYRNNGLQAETAFSELEKIRKKNGELTQEGIVAAASAPRHKLHGQFEWNDKTAASKFRLRQAGTLMRSIQVTYKEKPDDPIRVYEIAIRKPSGSEDKRTIYTTTQEMLATKEGRDELLRRAIADAMRFRRKFRVLHELDRIIEEIDKLVAEVV